MIEINIFILYLNALIKNIVNLNIKYNYKF